MESQLTAHNSPITSLICMGSTMENGTVELLSLKWLVVFKSWWTHPCMNCALRKAFTVHTMEKRQQACSQTSRQHQELNVCVCVCPSVTHSVCSHVYITARMTLTPPVQLHSHSSHASWTFQAPATGGAPEHWFNFKTHLFCSKS